LLFDVRTASFLEKLLHFYDKQEPPMKGKRKRFGAYCSQKVQLWWQQFLLIFL